MFLSIAIILICQLIGETISHAFALPVPGPVIGMVLLIAVLAVKERFGPILHGPERYAIERTGSTLLKSLSLLFVPAGVGIVDKLDIITKHGTALAASILISTILALIVSAVVFAVTARWVGSTEGGE